MKKINKNHQKKVHDLYSLMALKVLKFECIWYLFGALEVEKK
jgi:hypothetical protein